MSPAVVAFGLEFCRFVTASSELVFYAVPVADASVLVHRGRITGVCCRDRLLNSGLELLGRDRNPVLLVPGREDEAGGDDAARSAALGVTPWFEGGRAAGGTCGPAAVLNA